MIILHGSGGTWGGRGARHAELLCQNGIGALLIDTFTNRGLSKKDKYIPRLMEVNFPDQLADAFCALNALQSHPFVDENNIGVMGYSMGGISTILAAYENIAEEKGVTSEEENELHAFVHKRVDQAVVLEDHLRGGGGSLRGIFLTHHHRDQASVLRKCPAIL